MHRLVAEAFLGLSDLVVNHINGDKLDNRLENIEYTTPEQNSAHAAKSGLYKKGEDHVNSKMSNRDRKIAAMLHSAGVRISDLAKHYGYSWTGMKHIVTQGLKAA